MATSPASISDESFPRTSHEYRVQLDVFEGPLDLLYHMVRQEKVDISDIPIAKVTEQYLAYLDALEHLNIEPAADFLVMAARLLQIKARMLLPEEPAPDEDDEDEDPRLGLAMDLFEYALFKEAADELRQYEQLRDGLFGRPFNAKPASGGHVYPNPIGETTAMQLAEAFLNVLTATRSQPPVAVPRARVSVTERISLLRRLFGRKKRLSFDELFKKDDGRPVIVATFLALLELMRKGVLSCRRDETTARMIISRRV